LITSIPAYLKAQLAAGNRLPKRGGILLTIADKDKKHAAAIAEKLKALGYQLYATPGTAAFLDVALGISKVTKAAVIEKISCSEINLVINTRSDRKDDADARRIDRAALTHQIPVYSTIRSANAVCDALTLYCSGFQLEPVRLQDL